MRSFALGAHQRAIFTWTLSCACSESIASGEMGCCTLKLAVPLVGAGSSIQNFLATRSHTLRVTLVSSAHRFFSKRG